MSQSETIGSLAAALAKAQGQIQSAKRDSENPFYRSKYADLAAVWDACRKALAANELAVVQTTENRFSVGGNEGPEPIVMSPAVVLVTTLVHSSGEWIRGEYPLHPMRQVQKEGWVPSDDPQAIGSALTYARRYALAAIVGVAPDDDDDGEAAMGRPAQTQRQAPAGQPAQPAKLRSVGGPACPLCGVVGAILAPRGSYRKWKCWDKKGGCGATFDTDPALTTPAREPGVDDAEPPYADDDIKY